MSHFEDLGRKIEAMQLEAKIKQEFKDILEDVKDATVSVANDRESVRDAVKYLAKSRISLSNEVIRLYKFCLEHELPYDTLEELADLDRDI